MSLVYLQHGRSWKRLCVERTLWDIIENFKVIFYLLPNYLFI
jgi:hypothetical protein